MKNTTNISFNKKQLKLLMMILERCEDDRLNCSCNDAIENEKKLFTKKERAEICTELLADENDECFELFNYQYVTYLINLIKKQI